MCEPGFTNITPVGMDEFNEEINPQLSLREREALSLNRTKEHLKRQVKKLKEETVIAKKDYKTKKEDNCMEIKEYERLFWLRMDTEQEIVQLRNKQILLSQMDEQSNEAKIATDRMENTLQELKTIFNSLIEIRDRIRDERVVIQGNLIQFGNTVYNKAVCSTQRFEKLKKDVQLNSQTAAIRSNMKDSLLEIFSDMEDLDNAIITERGHSYNLSKSLELQTQQLYDKLNIGKNSREELEESISKTLSLHENTLQKTSGIVKNISEYLDTSCKGEEDKYILGTEDIFSTISNQNNVFSKGEYNDNSILIKNQIDELKREFSSVDAEQLVLYTPLKLLEEALIQIKSERLAWEKDHASLLHQPVASRTKVGRRFTFSRKSGGES